MKYNTLTSNTEGSMDISVAEIKDFSIVILILVVFTLMSGNEFAYHHNSYCLPGYIGSPVIKTVTRKCEVVWNLMIG